MLAKVRKVMSTNVPRVKSSDTILEATNVMNRERTSGAAVVEGEKLVGLITERALLWKFIPLTRDRTRSAKVRCWFHSSE